MKRCHWLASTQSEVPVPSLQILQGSKRVAVRAPAEAKAKGRVPSQDAILAVRWTIGVENVPENLPSPKPWPLPLMLLCQQDPHRNRLLFVVGHARC